eukprot:NODE_8970_length_388_cov_11.206490_g8079_i0.p1 GENE.NODE_8970_length_388_cov_11.206490_g8079_i0~~NODE_8970_length_388_cov_11.206490_g8079_i0.p1  ORF type:complete len:103 (-),score=25.95 NODE_8970_length_388_cov_11.206490_g8079_i0:16-324(-)
MRDGELSSFLVLIGMAGIVCLQVGLLFFAVLDGSLQLLYAAIFLFFCILIGFHWTFRYLSTLLVLLAFIGIVPSSFYMYEATKHHMIPLQRLRELQRELADR